MNLKSNLLLLNVANFTFNFARMLSGAIFIVVLEAQGIPLSTISIAKGSQLLISMILVLPCGVFADRYGGKYAVLLACCFSSCYYFLLNNPSHWRVISGEIFNGIALAFYIGAFEAWLFSLAPQKDAYNLHTNLARARELSYIGIVIGGLIGTYTGNYVFICSLVMMIASLCMFLVVRNKGGNKSISIHDKTKFFIPALKNLLSQKLGIFLLISSFLIGGSMQLIYQFWQPFFIRFSTLENSKQGLGLIFVAFMITQYVSSKIIRKYVLNGSHQMIFITGLCWAVAFFSITTTLITSNLYLAVATFCLFFGMIAVANNLLTSLLGELLEIHLQSTAISILDLLGKGMGCCLFFLGDGVISLEKYSFGWPLLIIIFLPLSIWAIMQRKKLWIPQTSIQ